MRAEQTMGQWVMGQCMITRDPSINKVTAVITRNVHG